MLVKQYRLFSALGLALLIVGCVATQSLDDIIGTGRIDITQRTWTHFQKYKNLPNNGAFAYNKRARYSYYNYCSEAQCTFGDRARDAIYGCKQKVGVGCKLLAQNDEIVWRGSIYVDGAKVHDGLDKASASTSSPIRLPAKYRMVSKTNQRPWRVGTIEVREDGSSNVFSAEFATNIRCEGSFLGGKRFKTSAKYFTTMRGECRFGKMIEPYSKFTGSLNVIAEHTGHIAAKDGQGVKTEIVFQP